MTVGAIIGVVIFAIIMIGCIILGAYLINDGAKKAGISTILGSVVVCGAFIAGICFWQFGTQSGARALKDQDSNFGDGINRTVTVYDINGNVIEQYTGEFDVETDHEKYILFDDQSGKRHIIYYTTGTVTIDEN